MMHRSPWRLTALSHLRRGLGPPRLDLGLAARTAANSERWMSIKSSSSNSSNSSSSWLPAGPDRLALLRALPKTDLHVHLDGCIRLSTLLELAAAHGVALPGRTEAELRTTVFKESYSNLPEYLEGYRYTAAVLRDYDSCRRVAYEFAIDNFRENVRFVEARFAPQLLAGNSPGFGIRDVLHAMNDGLQQAKREVNAMLPPDEPHFDYGIVPIACRFFTTDSSGYYRDHFRVHEGQSLEAITTSAAQVVAEIAVKCRDVDGLPIVGLDLASAEAGFPAKPFASSFAHAHRNLMHVTVHAGESYGPESIKQAVAHLGARRIGHGLELLNPHACALDLSLEEKQAYCSELADYVSRHNITLEVCLTSNSLTLPRLFKALHAHPLRQFLDRGVPVTLGTDSRLVCSTDMTNELSVAIDAANLSKESLRSIVLHGFGAAFYPGTFPEHRQYVQKATRMYDRVIQAHGL